MADALAHTGIPLGLVPAGTGNLLARNLDLPLEEVDAIEVALSGHVRQVDLVKIIVDDRAPEHFAVMAGIGVDAVIMDETDEGLKDKVGSAAYFVAAAKALGRLPVRMTVQLDGNRPVRRHAMLCVIGNVGTLRGNLILIPGASPDDGLLDLYIASPRRFRHWVKLALRLITRRAKKDDQVDQHTGTRVRIKIHGKDNYQLDGDVIGRGHHPRRGDPTGCPDHLRPSPRLDLQERSRHQFVATVVIKSGNALVKLPKSAAARRPRPPRNAIQLRWLARRNSSPEDRCTCRR